MPLIWRFSSRSQPVSVLPDLPAGWDAITGAGFVDAFSLLPGPPPTGTDVAPGSSLGLFSLLFDTRVGAIAFQVVFANPIDPVNPALVDGVTEQGGPIVPRCRNLLR